MPDPEPAATAAEPLAVAGDPQDVVQALARIAAASIAAGLRDLGGPILAGLTPGYVENKLSQMVLAHVVCTPGGSARPRLMARERRPA